MQLLKQSDSATLKTVTTHFHHVYGKIFNRYVFPTVCFDCSEFPNYHPACAPHYNPTCAVHLLIIPPVQCASLSSHLCSVPHYHPTCAVCLIIIPPVQCASLSSHLIIILLLFSCAELDEVTVQLFKQSNKRTFGNLTKVSFVLKCSLEPFLQMSWPYLK